MLRWSRAGVLRLETLAQQLRTAMGTAAAAAVRVEAGRRGNLQGQGGRCAVLLLCLWVWGGWG